MKPKKTTKLPSYLEVGVFQIGRVHAGMDRITLIPRNKIFNAYIHFFNGPDPDEDLHDHPWWSLSILLRGELIEITPEHPKGRKAPRICLRPPNAAHSIIKGSWKTKRPVTLFITGPKIRDWGFFTKKGWVTHEQYIQTRDRK